MKRELNEAQAQNVRAYLQTYIDEYSDHHDKGDETAFVCPFCKGGHKSEWSFNLNFKKGVGRCWRAKNCGWAGSVEKFIMDTSGCSFEQAKEVVNGGSGVENTAMHFDYFVNSLRGKKREAPLSYDIYDEWPGCVDLSEVDYKVLDSIDYWLEFERGYEPEQFHQRHEILWPPQIGIARGMVCFVVRTNESVAYQLYRFDGKGLKTHNPQDQKLSFMLYNYNNVKRKKVVFVTEGIFDCARLDYLGFGAVCCFGVRLQSYQRYLLKLLPADEIVFAFDGEREATRLAKDAAKSLAKMDGTKLVSFLQLPEGKDPDDLYEDDVLDLYNSRVIVKNERAREYFEE